MSTETVKQIITRAVTEPEFRELLTRDLNKALEGYEIREEERAALEQLSREGFDSLGGELEERISRAGLMGLGQRRTTGGGTGATCACW